MNNQFDLLIDSYLDNKIGIDAGFLNKALSNGLQQNILQLQKDELMTAAGIGNEEIKDSNQKMRGDEIYWMDKKHSNVYEQEFLQLVEVAAIAIKAIGNINLFIIFKYFEDMGQM